MIKFINKYSDQINGYLFVLPAFLIIGLFGIFPVFFGMYMSVHKWKVFKGRFLGFENYQKIVGDIGSLTSDLQIQYGRIPGQLELGLVKAKALGLTMANLNKSGDSLLNIESCKLSCLKLSNLTKQLFCR